MKTQARPHRSRFVLTGVLTALALTLGWACTSTGERDSIADRRAVILQAIRFVESGGLDDCPDGDGGDAIGPFQIHEVYWLDAVQADPSLGPGADHDYQDCRDRRYAEAIVAAYMQRYVPEAWERADAEVIARTHNGGPTGADKTSTVTYWRRVQSVLRARGRG